MDKRFIFKLLRLHAFLALTACTTSNYFKNENIPLTQNVVVVKQIIGERRNSYFHVDLIYTSKTKMIYIVSFVSLQKAMHQDVVAQLLESGVKECDTKDSRYKKIQNGTHLEFIENKEYCLRYIFEITSSFTPFFPLGAWNESKKFGKVHLQFIDNGFENSPIKIDLRDSQYTND